VTEAEVRALRDELFVEKISDDNWSRVKAFWMQPREIEWLQEQLSGAAEGRKRQVKGESLTKGNKHPQS